MVEVFKTNVEFKQQACELVELIQGTFPGYKANFDLNDCDKILRVVCTGGSVDAPLLIVLLNNYGCYAQILPDEQNPASHIVLINDLLSKYQ